MTKRTEEEEEMNDVLSMTVVASEKQREKLKKENEELVETNTFLIEDLRRREVQLNTIPRKSWKSTKRCMKKRSWTGRSKRASHAVTRWPWIRKIVSIMKLTTVR